MFAENQGLYVVSTSPENHGAVDALCFDAGIECVSIGSVGGRTIDLLKLHDDQPDEQFASVSLADLRAAHEGFFPKLMGSELTPEF